MELTVGTVLEGKVKSITNFGAFIALPENKTGMVHISEVANAYVSDIRQHLTEGQDIFGVYALMMQSCDQRQKEIAVRKVFGAKVKDILLMFFKQYMLQVVMAAFVAFPVGYFLMKNWMEQYARQTDISIWIFLCIFLGMSLLVTLCIGWRVWKVANENPAVVIKKE